MHRPPVLLVAACLLLAACGGEADDGRTTLEVWYHTGKPAERAVLERQVADFEAANPTINVELTLIPEGGYHQQVQAAAVAGRLPDVLDLDGPYLASYAWQGRLLPLEDLIEPSTLAELLPSLVAQGTWNDHLWGIGTFDSGLGLYVNRALLPSGTELPTSPSEAWSAVDFTLLLERLAKAEREAGADGAVLDLRLNDRGGEWWTYAFSPIVQSAGADLIDRDTLTASGTLDSPSAIAALERLQSWVVSGRVDDNTDAQAFVDGRVALSWSGHWDYPRYRKALGDDLAVVPLPDFGTGSRTGMGSWAWAVSADSEHPEAAAAFIGFLLQTDEVLVMAHANGAVPATTSAVELSPLYAEDGDLALFAQQLRESAVPRPVTPAYPAITDAFQRAMDRILSGGPVDAALGEAATAIDQDVADNQGYPALP